MRDVVSIVTFYSMTLVAAIVASCSGSMIADFPCHLVLLPFCSAVASLDDNCICTADKSCCPLMG